MPKYTKEIHQQEIDKLGKAYMRYLIGTGAILSLWFFSSVYFLFLIWCTIFRFAFLHIGLRGWSPYFLPQSTILISE